jgi:SSS family solute:Na+ symporter
LNSFLWLLVFYIILGTGIAIYTRGAKTQEEYFIAGRRVGGLISALTYAATTYSAFMMVGLVGLTYLTGVGAAGFELMYLVGTLFLLSYYAPKVWKLGREKNIVSPAEFLKLRYGDATAKLASLIALIALIPYISAQLIGVALILENAGMAFIYGIAIAATLIALWAYIGGLRGVALTDAVQGVIMLVSAILAVVFVSSNADFGNISKLGELLYVPNRFWTFQKFAALVTPWFFFALTNPQVFQRLLIPKTETDLKKMVIYFGLFGLIYTFLVTMLGLELRIMSETGAFPFVSDRDKVTPTLLTFMPEWISLLVALSILAAAITTANSIILSLSSMVSRDLVRERGIIVGRLSVLILTIAVALFASQRVSYIVELSVLSSTILLCQLPLIIGYFHWRRGGKITGVVTLLTGFTASISLWYLRVSPFGLPASVFTLILVVIVYILFSMIEGKSKLK